MADFDYGDPAIEWEEANAANADGQAVQDAERAAGMEDSGDPEPGLCHFHGGSRSEDECTACQAEAADQPAGGYEIRVRKSESPRSWVKLPNRFPSGDLAAALEHASNIATHVLAELRPAEVLIIGPYVPEARWLDGKQVAPESLTPGHPGGCACGECCIRWAHHEGRPGHEPCDHGACRRCNTCDDCDWDEAYKRYQDYAARKLTAAADGINQALSHVVSADDAFRDLEREERQTEFSIDHLNSKAVGLARDKLNRAVEELQDAARILEVYQLRARLAAAEAQIPLPRRRPADARAGQ